MANVSKNKLKPKIARDITDQFVTTISSLDKEAALFFFEEFFTKTERLMFAKRLAALLLLREGFSSYRISQLLKMSKTTVGILDDQFSHSEKETIATTCGQFNSGTGLVEDVRKFLVDGMSLDPKRRTKWLNEFEKRYQY